jgi:hypothetical protein
MKEIIAYSRIQYHMALKKAILEREMSFAPAMSSMAHGSEVDLTLKLLNEINGEGKKRTAINPESFLNDLFSFDKACFGHYS